LFQGKNIIEEARADSAGAGVKGARGPITFEDLLDLSFFCINWKWEKEEKGGQKEY